MTSLRGYVTTLFHPALCHLVSALHVVSAHYVTTLRYVRQLGGSEERVAGWWAEVRT